MPKLFMAVLAVALFASPQLAPACLNDSLTDRTEHYFSQIYRSLKYQSADSYTPGQSVMAIAGLLLLAGGTARLLRANISRRNSSASERTSPRARAKAVGVTSSVRSGGRELASRDSQSA